MEQNQIMATEPSVSKEPSVEERVKEFIAIVAGRREDLLDWGEKDPRNLRLDSIAIEFLIASIGEGFGIDTGNGSDFNQYIASHLGTKPYVEIVTDYIQKKELGVSE